MFVVVVVLLVVVVVVTVVSACAYGHKQNFRNKGIMTNAPVPTVGFCFYVSEKNSPDFLCSYNVKHSGFRFRVLYFLSNNHDRIIGPLKAFQGKKRATWDHLDVFSAIF